MQIAVITTPRTPEYIYETIRQIREGHAPHGIEAFSDDPRHRVSVCPTRLLHWTLQVKRDQATRGAHRACINFFHALTSGVGDLMLFEDDVAVRPTWYTTLEQIRKGSGADLVSLYWPDGDHLAEGIYGDAPVQWRHYRKPETVHGTLGLFVSGRVRYALAQWIDSALRGDGELGPFDNMVAWWLHRHPHVSIVAAVPAQVDHRGVESAIPENRDHGLRSTPGW